MTAPEPIRGQLRGPDPPADARPPVRATDQATGDDLTSITKLRPATSSPPASLDLRRPRSPKSSKRRRRRLAQRPRPSADGHVRCPDPTPAPPLLVVAGDNPDRLSTARHLSPRLLGASPIQRVLRKDHERKRLNRGGDRQGNSALWHIVITRMASRPSHQGLRRTPHQGRPVQARNHPLPQTLRRPRSLQRTTPRSPRLTVGASLLCRQAPSGASSDRRERWHTVAAARSGEGGSSVDVGSRQLAAKQYVQALGGRCGPCGRLRGHPVRLRDGQSGLTRGAAAAVRVCCRSRCCLRAAGWGRASARPGRTTRSSAPSAVLVSVIEEFKVPRVAAALVITIFLLGYVAGPLLFAPLSEFYGRRWLFYGTFTLYIAFNFLCAFAPNFASLLIGRLLTGIFASAPLTNAPGVLADIWDPIRRGNAIALFSMMTFCGPALGPVIAGFLELKKDWRWCFYVILWLGGITEVLLFTIPETYGPVVLMNKARRIRRAHPEKYAHVQSPAEAAGRSLRAVFKVALIRPWQILFDPISLFVAIYISFVYMLLYMLFTIYPIVFQMKRGWNSGVGELPLIGTVIGACMGGAVVFWKSKKDGEKVKQGIVLKPEARLGLTMFAGILFPVSTFGFAWSANYNSVHWFVPTMFGTFLSMSIMLIFVGYLNYLTDSYLMYTASAMAANTIMRSACGAAAPLFTEQMFEALGVGGGGSLIGGVACLLAPIPFIFNKYGEQIRIKSKFAPTPQANQGQQHEKPDDEEKQHNTGERPASFRGSSDSASTVSDSGSITQTESPEGGPEKAREDEIVR